MEITHRNEADDGELPVRMYGGTFADIQLSPGTYLTMRTPADCNRLIKAAAAAKSLLLGEDIPPLLAQDLGIAEASPANPYGSTLASLRGPEHYEAAEGVESQRLTPFPHLAQHVGSDLRCIICGQDHDAAARATLAPYHLASISRPGPGNAA